jgi:alpha-ketoglutarate-dependent taurine dioxygenase
VYRALSAFQAVLRDENLAVWLPLRPGSMLVFDNTRVLHGRAGFSPASGRTLVGCYLDADVWKSRLRVLHARRQKQRL